MWSSLMMPWVAVDLSQPPDLMWTISGSISDPFVGSVVFVVDADLVDVGEFDGFLGGGSKQLAALVHHRGDDAVGDAGVFEGDERIGVGGVVAGLGVDGLEDEVVAEAGLCHLDDGVVVHGGG